MNSFILMSCKSKTALKRSRAFQQYNKLQKLRVDMVARMC